MTRLLSLFGLMRVREHEAKFKAAITDLAAATEEIADLTPDALAMRKKRQRDKDRARDKRANRRKGVANG